MNEIDGEFRRWMKEAYAMGAQKQSAPAPEVITLQPVSLVSSRVLRHTPGRRRPLITVALALFAGCSSSSEPKPDPSGDYSQLFWSPDSAGIRLSVTGSCERYLQRGLVGLSGHWFDISINLFEDCRPVGGSYQSYEVLVVGTFQVRHDTIDFESDDPGAPEFQATFSTTALTLHVPAWPDRLGVDSLLIALPKVPPN